MNKNWPKVYMYPSILNPSPTCLPTPSLQFVPEHWFWVPPFMHWTHTGHLFYTWWVHAQSFLTLCNPLGHSPLCFSVHGIFQARILEWMAIPFSRNLPDPGMEPVLSGVSRTGRQILYHWAMMVTLYMVMHMFQYYSLKSSHPTIFHWVQCFFWNEEYKIQSFMGLCKNNSGLTTTFHLNHLALGKTQASCYR